MEDKAQVLITGGEGELAQAIAGALQLAGMGVMSPGRTLLDVRDEASVEAYFTGVKDLDLLVCNAGVTDDGLLIKMAESSWDGVIDTHLKGAFLTAKAAAKVMMKRKPKNRGGHIVFISSYSAFHPPVGQANYAAAKAALKGFALSLAKELGGRNIRVNVIVPGFMETKMTRDVSEVVRESAIESHSLSDFNTVDAVAKFLKCLHLDMLYTSGQVFNLDSRVI